MSNQTGKNKGWKFDEHGNFHLKLANYSTYLYFPLVNEAGMISSITPKLHGDAKVDQNTFLLRPVSVEDLHNSNDARNFWIKLQNGKIWSATGNSALQKSKIYTKHENSQNSLEAGFLWHKIINEDNKLGLKATITNFIPVENRTVELMEVKVTNISDNELTITPIAAIPIFGRSADNLRDHRHVTSLLHQIFTKKYGIIVKPTMHFDERGHKKNDISYAVFGADDNEDPPIGFYPIVEDYIGLGGSYDWPKKVVKDDLTYVEPNMQFSGFEAIGGLRFKTITLKPAQNASFRIVLSISSNLEQANDQQYLYKDNFTKSFIDMQDYWNQKHLKLSFYLGDSNYNHWLKWVSIQPILRRIMGCSFLPYHDYGRGGRGWRDLWQDCLSLIFLEPDQVRDIILKSFGGVRIDGSNATIIGKELGEFTADRNSIPRVWMDHGAWPLLTTQLYIDETGDLEILLKKQFYFKDKHIFRCKKIDNLWNDTQGTKLLQKNGKPYKGTILEHLIIENLTSFFNVGDHNIFLLEGADWNDGMDMASERGESVAFTALYAYNLSKLIDLLQEIKIRMNLDVVHLAQEISILFDSFTNPIEYNSVKSKKDLFETYLNSYQHNISGEMIEFSINDIINDLIRKSKWLNHHIKKNEWISCAEGYSWFNGYYNNIGERLEGDHEFGVRMTLAGQVFTILSHIADENQVIEIINSVDRYLWDDKVGGVRMNTNFYEILLNMGRSFGFAYGNKENGAMFSHLAMMFAYALYERRKSEYAYKIVQNIYNHCKNFEISRIYPGIPEYINSRGRGMYTYLTGSASWYLLTMITKVFGIRGKVGDLILDPQLRKDQFNTQGLASLKTQFLNRSIHLFYQNPKKLEPSEYRIQSVKINGNFVDFKTQKYGILIKKENLVMLNDNELNYIKVLLGS